MHKYLYVNFLWIIVAALIISACGQAASNPTPVPPSGSDQVQIININEGNTTSDEITQTKVFDQCQSSSPLNADISFNDIASTESGDQLVLGATVGGEVGLSEVAKVSVQGSIQKYYSNKQGQSFGHQESINIEVPPNSKQEYDIVWTVSHQQGSVDYSENGQNKSINYNYRLGVQLSSSSVKNLDCPGGEVPTQNPPVSAPQIQATEPPAPTLSPLYPLSNNGVADGDGLRLTATVLCVVNCGGPQFSVFDPLINIHYTLTNTSQQTIIIPKFGGDESYISLNTGQQLYDWTSIGWCDRTDYIDSQSIGPGDSIKWEWGYKLKNNECGGTGTMLPLPDNAQSFTIVFPAIGKRFGGTNWNGNIPR